MGLTAHCPQGHKLTAKEKLAGKRVKCPACGQPVQIPELPRATPSTNELGAGELASGEALAPLPDADWQAAPLGDHDPLALPDSAGLESWAESTPFPSAPFPASNSPSSSYPGSAYPSAAYPSSPGSAMYPQPASPAPNVPAQSKPAIPWALVAGVAAGVLSLLVMIGVALWLTLGRDKSPAVATTVRQPVAASEPTPPAVVAPSPPATTRAPAETPPAPPPSAPTPEEPLPPIPPTPFDLARVALDPRLDAFQLPASTWAAAFDETTGRLAITHDQQGILVYNLDHVARGRLAPEKIWPTAGVPTAICFKALEGRRLFVVASRDTPQLMLYDADLLSLWQAVPMSNLNFVDFLAASTNVDDPYVYYSTQAQGLGPSSHTAGAAQDPNAARNANRMGRVDVRTGAQDELSVRQFTDFTISTNGRRIWAREDKANSVVVGDWDEIRAPLEAPRKGVTRSPTTVGFITPVRGLENMAAIRGQVFTPTLSIVAARPGFAPGGVFTHRPLMFGTFENLLVFGSTNDYRQLDAIPLPPHWRREKSPGDPTDFRERPLVSLDLDTPFLEFFADSRRERAIVTMGKALLVAPLAKLKLPNEPSLWTRADWPTKVAAGQPLELPASTWARLDGVSFEAIPNSFWLPDESQLVLGAAPDDKDAGRTLRLQRDVKLDQKTLHLEDYTTLSGKRFPFGIRVGREIMVARRFKNGQLTVDRSQLMTHNTQERVALVDEQGRDEIAKPAKLDGIPLVMEAGMGSDQDFVFVRDIAPLAGETLPREMRIGVETMTLVGIDDRKRALKLQRPNPIPHSVSDPILVTKSPSSDSPPTEISLPVFAGSTLRWTPDPSQSGPQIVRLRTRLGQLTREWFWEVLVERAPSGAELPFYVRGVEPMRGSHLAVLWGQSQPPPPGQDPGGPGDKSQPILAVYDRNAGAVLRQAVISSPIWTATMDSTGIYVAYRSASQSTSPINSTPTRIARFDPETLAEGRQVDVAVPVRQLQTIAGRYLYAPGVRLTIPDLGPVEPEPAAYGYAIAGRCRSGWVWDGVLWDDTFKSPQLMLFPAHFESAREASTATYRSQTIGGSIQLGVQGCFTCTFVPPNMQLYATLPLLESPGGLQYQDGALHGYSWSDLTRQRVGNSPPVKVAQLLEPDHSPNGRNKMEMAARTVHLAEADGFALVALEGRLHRVPLNKLVPNVESFRLVERQSEISLLAGQPAQVAYSAPGAVRYRLEILPHRTEHFDEQFQAPTLESKDGTFQLSLSKTDPIVTYALARVLDFDVTMNRDQRLEVVAEYLRRVAPVFERLTGSPPRGIPSFVHVNVVAEHGDGQQRAGLAHCYLIELPIDWIRDEIQ